MDTFEISPVNQAVLRSATQLQTKDFEDAVQIASALADGLEFIITRDVKDFELSPIKALTSVEFMLELA